MNTLKKIHSRLLLGIVISFLVCSQTYAQGSSGGAAFLNKQQRTVIIDAILSGDMNRIRSLVKRSPKTASGVAALTAKHKAQKGIAAGETAAAVATAIDADITQASEITAAVCQSTTASLDEAGQIADEVAKALGLTSNIDSHGVFIGMVVKNLGLKGEQAGDFIAIVARNNGYKGYDLGKFAGIAARESGATGPEIEAILAAIMGALNPSPDEAEQIVAALELETGEKITVIREESPEDGPAARQPKALVPNPIDDILDGVLAFDQAKDTVDGSSFIP